MPIVHDLCNLSYWNTKLIKQVSYAANNRFKEDMLEIEYHNKIDDKERLRIQPWRHL